MVEINRGACTGCGHCTRDCIAKNLSLREGKAEVSGTCILCGHCVAVCPVNAVSIPEYDMADVEELSQEQVKLDSDRLLKAIKFRRSVRNFKQKPVCTGDLNMLVQAGRYTATAKNMQDCFFIFVQEELETLKTLIWDGIGRILDSPVPGPTQPYRGFYKAHMADARQDYLSRNAPAVLFIASESNIDAGLAAQNMELMGVSLGLGFLYNGYLRRAAEMNHEVMEWLGVGEKRIEACALLGYPDITYKRTAPRRTADVILL